MTLNPYIIIKHITSMGRTITYLKGLFEYLNIDPIIFLTFLFVHIMLIIYTYRLFTLIPCIRVHLLN